MWRFIGIVSDESDRLPNVNDRGSHRRCDAPVIAGERDPRTIAQLARSRLRAKLVDLEEAFHGRFDDHHAFLLARMLARVDAVDADIAAVEAQIEAHVAPFAQAVTRLQQIPGVGPAIAQVIVAEIGVDMGRFPTGGHLASWAKVSPVISESAGKRTGKNTTGHGNRYLARALGQAAVNAGKTDTFLGERYRRIARRRARRRPSWPSAAPS